MFFIRSPDSKMSAIETFLKKRNYDVTIETDIKEALVKLIEKQPEYVFLAFDHPNSKIMNLSTIIDQSILTTIIAFVHTNSKDSMRKLNFSGYKYKLYPPLSGPAIERLILKIEKEKQAETASHSAVDQAHQSSVKPKNSDDIVNVKSKAIEKLNDSPQVSSDLSSKTTGTEKYKLLTDEQKKRRTSSLKTKRNLFSNFSRKPLVQEQKTKLKTAFDNEIKTDLIDLETNFEEAAPTTAFDLKATEAQVIEMNKSADSSLSSKEPLTEAIGGVHFINKKTSLCLVVESENWTGFVVGATDGELESQMIAPLLTKWISAIYPEAIDNENYDFYHANIDQVKIGEWARSKADHYEVAKFRNTNILLSAFAIEPSDLTFNVVEKDHLIEVPIEIFPEQLTLDFNLFLYLPENNKYILYARTDQVFSADQKKRLADKKVNSMFVSIEAEYLIKQLKVQFLFQNFLDQVKKESFS